MAAELKLSEDQTTRVREGIRKLFTEMRSRFASAGSGNGFPNMNAAQGGDPEAMRERMAQMRAQMADNIGKVYREFLTPEQYSRYQQLRRQQEETRSSRIWIQDAAGKIRPVTVRLGLSDDNYTQIVGGDVKQGDKVITRVSEGK